MNSEKYSKGWAGEGVWLNQGKMKILLVWGYSAKKGINSSMTTQGNERVYYGLNLG